MNIADVRSRKFCVGWIASAGERDAKGLTDAQVERSGAVVPLGRLGTLGKRHSFFEVSLCLSRACLGKMMHF
jgi:hypothetical protein